MPNPITIEQLESAAEAIGLRVGFTLWRPQTEEEITQFATRQEGALILHGLTLAADGALGSVATASQQDRLLAEASERQSPTQKARLSQLAQVISGRAGAGAAGAGDGGNSSDGVGGMDGVDEWVPNDAPSTTVPVGAPAAAAASPFTVIDGSTPLPVPIQPRALPREPKKFRLGGMKLRLPQQPAKAAPIPTPNEPHTPA